MKKVIQVHTYKGEQYYIEECIDLPVATQGKTLDEVVANLKEAVALHLEGENLTDYDLVPQPTIIAKDGTMEKDDFLALEGTLKNVNIERPIKELRRKWKK